MKKWFLVALINLFVLALLGLVLRYKINFPLPFLQQENLLHAHSHFAFNGWIGFILQVLIVQAFTKDYEAAPTFWNRFFGFSTVVNYAMIFSFASLGYNVVSIVLSTIALWLSYLFVYKVLKALPKNTINNISVRFIQASLFFLVISSIGPYALAGVMAAKSNHQYWYHNALYFFLHFQYNGWFTFAVLGFLFAKLEHSAAFNRTHARYFFVLLTVACIPSYLFTSLWHHRPFWVFLIIVVTALLQTLGLYFFYVLLKKNMRQVYVPLPAICRYLYTLAIGAFVLKILLQFFSLHPQLAKLAFGFRPIIIGYLHLIFLVFITLFILSYLADKKVLALQYKPTSYGLITFAAGILLNETLLAIQGVTGIFYVFVPWLNLALYANTFVLIAGAALLIWANWRSAANDQTFFSTDKILL